MLLLTVQGPHSENHSSSVPVMGWGRHLETRREGPDYRQRPGTPPQQESVDTAPDSVALGFRFLSFPMNSANNVGWGGSAPMKGNKIAFWTKWHYKDQTNEFFSWRKRECSRLLAWYVSTESECVRKSMLLVYLPLWRPTAARQTVQTWPPRALGWPGEGARTWGTFCLGLAFMTHCRVKVILLKSVSTFFSLWFLYLRYPLRLCLTLLQFSSKYIHYLCGF